MICLRVQKFDRVSRTCHGVPRRCTYVLLRKTICVVSYPPRGTPVFPCGTCVVRRGTPVLTFLYFHQLLFIFICISYCLSCVIYMHVNYLHHLFYFIYYTILAINVYLPLCVLMCLFILVNNWDKITFLGQKLPLALLLSWSNKTD